ncbi:DUF4097 family beta strand repeat-containing protein [Paludicola sp. MB14-C6]|uniref:DUF4097 family beta strand repeat-containing protein n=1 Tax=Paludihabitans sp. MB14-C6 TaxID=3070656 RepID=UPI0027DE3D81|nr:DUF4097 family beta strand repeat-containing protein [Paludicola sp. MB14-C6]WMJ24102.1 DUF4097 family beta strand repeat-containing protein [Paludicola sp. MB14-C6]
MKVSKRIPFTIYTIICVVLLLLLLLGIGSLTKVNRYRHQESQSNGSLLYENQNHPIDAKDAVNYRIDCGYGKVTIKPTNDKPYINYINGRPLRISTQTNNGECEIRLKSYKEMGYDFFNHIFENKTREIEIYLPKTKLNQVIIIAAANTINVEGLQVRKMDIDLSAGDVSVKNCEIDEMKSELNAGNLDFYANKGIQKIDSEVNAGNMDLYLPKDISGFLCDYEADLGSIDHNASFTVHDEKKDEFVNTNGTLTYGDQSCKIKLEVSVGNISIDDYDNE